MEKNYLIKIETNKLMVRAQYHFIKICGFARNPTRSKPMLDMGYKILEKVKQQLEMKIVVTEYPSEVFVRNELIINGKHFTTDAFQELDEQKVLKVYAYIMTAGEIICDTGEISHDFYADTWGTAFVDALQDQLKEWIRQENTSNKVQVSNSYGPGLSGMDILLIKDMLEILDGDRIGVTLTSGNMMKPSKTCAGFYFLLEDTGELPEKHCEDCLMKEKNCSFCRLNRTEK